MRTLRRLLALGGSAALTIGFSVIGTGPAQPADRATVSILHGVPGATVDVYVDGKALLKALRHSTGGALGLEGFTIVDVSIEPYDGNPEHSRDSQVRGTLPE
jgi:hypothetical protein